MSKIFGFAILFGILMIMGWGIYQLSGERRILEKKSSGLKAEIDALKESVGQTEEEIKYFSRPENLEKEAKSQFNYRRPDEKLIIIIPATSTKK